jgi:hypothetical protein
MIRARLPCSKFRWTGKPGHCNYFSAGAASRMAAVCAGAVLLHLTTAHPGIYEY